METISFTYVMTRYLVMFVITAIVAFVFNELADRFFENNFASAGASALPIVLPALDAGTTIYKKWQVKLKGKSLWKLASILALENIVLSGLIVAILLFQDPLGAYSLININTQIIIISFLIGFGICLATTLIFLSMGMKQAKKLYVKQTKDVF